MSLVLVIIGIILISPVIAFILLAIQLLIAGVPISDIWKKREGRFNPPKETHPAIDEYENRLSDTDLGRWIFAAKEFNTILSNPDKLDLILGIPSDKCQEMLLSAKRFAQLLTGHSDEEISNIAYDLIKTIDVIDRHLNISKSKPFKKFLVWIISKVKKTNKYIIVKILSDLIILSSLPSGQSESGMPA